MIAIYFYYYILALAICLFFVLFLAILMPINYSNLITFFLLEFKLLLDLFSVVIAYPSLTFIIVSARLVVDIMWII
jgi:hypothetical protein